MATSNILTQPFIADPKSIARLNGATVDWATVTDVDADGNKYIPAGTIMSRETNGFAPAKDAATDVCGIIETSAYAHDQSSDSLSGYGIIISGVIYQNLLPDAGEVNFATWQGTLATAGTGIGWVWLDYGDSRDAST